jgi:alpha-galactosidase
VLLHGVVATDGTEALMAHVQLDESAHNRGVQVRVPGLDQQAMYSLEWELPTSLTSVSMSATIPEGGPTAGVELTGEVLATRGYWVPRRRPETVTLVKITRVRA